MARNGNHRPKVRIGISPDPDLLEWVDRHIGPGKRFATRTHAFEAGITCLVEQSGGELVAAAKLPLESGR